MLILLMKCGGRAVQTRLLSPTYRLRLIRVKFLHRYYKTPIQLCRMGLCATAECLRCHPDTDFLHLA